MEGAIIIIILNNSPAWDDGKEKTAQQEGFFPCAEDGFVCLGVLTKVLSEHLCFVLIDLSICPQGSHARALLTPWTRPQHSGLCSAVSGYFSMPVQS